MPGVWCAAHHVDAELCGARPPGSVCSVRQGCVSSCDVGGVCRVPGAWGLISVLLPPPRYLFALQLKRDLLEERLTCTDTTAALLASHLLQGECPHATHTHGTRCAQVLLRG